MKSKTVSLRDAKARLGELADLTAAGIDIVITRRCKPLARLTTVRASPKAIDLVPLQTLTNRTPCRPTASPSFVSTFPDQVRDRLCLRDPAAACPTRVGARMAKVVDRPENP